MTTQATANALETLYETAPSSTAYVTGFFGRMAELMKAMDTEGIAKLIDVVEKACEQNKTIFVIGNGGSAAVASHIVNDLCPNSLVEGKPGFRAFSLTDNVESLTAIANDAGYEHIFSYQLKHDMCPGDVVIALSVSGNSPNIIEAVQYANDHGAYTVGISGFSGGRLAELSRHSIHIPTTPDEYGPVEDLFSNIGHIVTGYLTMKRGRKLAH